jgi:hypothetical protein
MSFLENLTKVALLGTEKQSVALADAPQSIKALADALPSEPAAKLLQLTAMAINYEKAGKKANSLPDDFQVDECKPESMEIIGKKAQSILENLLYEKRNSLILFYLYHFTKQKRLASPQLLPKILNFGKTNTDHKELLMRFVGNRGMWLAVQNPAWQYLLPHSLEEDWLHGTMEERKKALKKIRNTQPSKAITLLEVIWTEESASQRLDYLSILEKNLSETDEDFLTGKLTDRSGKVKAEAMRLLQSIPSSAMSQQVWENVSACFSIKTNKKTEESAPTALEVIFKAKGNEPIEEKPENEIVNAEEAEKNNAYVEILELVKTVLPTRWEQHFGLTITELVEVFANSKKIKRFLSVVIEAVIYYQQERWARTLLNSQYGSDARLIAILPYQEREKYALKLLKEDADEVIESMLNEDYQEWSLTFTQKLMEVAITDVYAFNKDFFKKLIPFLHFEINKEILSYSFQDDYRKGYWTGTATEISYLLGLREEIKQVV